MATMTVRSTFALDPSTESSIQRLAQLWNVSKAEVVRRSVAAANAAAAAKQTPTPLAALDWLQSQGTLTEEQVEAWSRDSRQGWEEAFARHEKPVVTKRKKP
jgi:hypothetical protein